MSAKSMSGIRSTEENPDVRWRAASVRVALGAGAALIAVALAVTFSRGPLVVTGTNSIPNTTVVAATLGPAHFCQGGEVVPQGTTAVRVWLQGNVQPRVRIAVLARSRTVASGTQAGGWLGKVMTVPIPRLQRTLRDAQLCLSIDRAVQALNLLGGPVSHPAPGEAASKVRVEYLRPGPSSWWSLVSTVSRRLGIGRAPEGSWVALIPLATMALAALLATWTIWRSLVRAPRAAAWACACVAFLSAAGWSIVTPPFQAPDEPSHFAYTQILAETGSLPSSSASAYSQEELAALVGLDHEAVRFNTAIETISSDAQRQRLRYDLAQPLSRTGTAAGVAASEPPLYYALETFPYLLGSGGTLLERLELMRLLSALLAAAAAFFVFLFLREALPAVPWAWTVGGLCMALFPLLGYMSGVVNPDAMLCAVAAALFYCLARGFRRGLTRRLALTTGGVIALGLLTKLNFLGIAPGALLALALLARRAARTPGDMPHARGARHPGGAPPGARHTGGERSGGRAPYGWLAAAVAVAFAPICVYVLATLSNHAAFGAVSEGVSNTGHHGSLLDELSYIWQFYLPRLPGMTDYFPGISTLRQVWFDKLVGQYGWLDTHFAGWVYTLALIAAAPIAALCVRELLRVRVALRARAAELIAYALMALGLLVLFGADSYLETPQFTGAFSEARYLLPLAALFAAGAALAARGAGRRWGPAVGALLVLAILAHNIFSQLQVVARFYG
ncbi:MAG TPA: DUF2142 domain-containing protein [Solirubrobacteraceae bacterium]|nr:DUF2142 domain-containing protein [Solirubrobacteraceae bacterium]